MKVKNFCLGDLLFHNIILELDSWSIKMNSCLIWLFPVNLKEFQKTIVLLSKLCFNHKNKLKFKCIDLFKNKIINRNHKLVEIKCV